MAYETVIGLEIHAQLLTKSKMFCSCSAGFGGQPNTNICPVCTGQPGVLPVMNKRAIELAIKTAIALNCTIEPRSVFARKNYFYPDLPKDYQVSQYELPLATKGKLDILVNGKLRSIGITRVHLEEDAGKLVHQGASRIMGAESSLVDYNRTGVPLMEIVSEPDIRSPQEAQVFMQTLAQLLEYIGVCDAKMEEGSLRCDANLSIRPFGENKLGTKTELKNMNSFKAVEKGLLAEEKRHREALEQGANIIQETRFFDEATNTTSGMRSKEFAHDYRYFPEPDLVPVEPEKHWIDKIRQELGELPDQRRDRFKKDLNLPEYEAGQLVSNRSLADFFETTLKYYDNPKVIANWLLGELTALLKEQGLSIDQSGFTPAQLAELLKQIDNSSISGKIAKEVLAIAQKSGKQVLDIIKESGLTQISDENDLLQAVKEVIKNNPKPVAEYRSGKKTAVGFLVGQLMKLTKGRANPSLANKLVLKELEGEKT
jgi:aspartyl-tRNA(Asn)/glutamyl-tRNA(Gln) amidotransferase subunit B